MGASADGAGALGGGASAGGAASGAAAAGAGAGSAGAGGGASTGSVFFGMTALTAVRQDEESPPKLRCKQRNASTPPGLTPEQCDMKSDRHEARMALICSWLGCWASAWPISMTDATRNTPDTIDEARIDRLTNIDMACPPQRSTIGLLHFGRHEQHIEMASAMARYAGANRSIDRRNAPRKCSTSASSL
jgi:hypothetical protein